MPERKLCVYTFAFYVWDSHPELQMVGRHKISGAGMLKGLDFAKYGR